MDFEPVYEIVGGALITTGIIGSTLVITYFAFREQRKTSYNLFILLLAISDLVGSLSYLAEWISIILNHWPFGGALCKFLTPLPKVCLMISSFLMLGLAYERYYGITKPLSTRRIKRRHVYIYFCVISICSSLYQIPIFIAFKMEDGYCRNYLQFTMEEQLSYDIVYECTKGIIPFILMTYFYFHIKKTLKHHEKSLQSTITLKRNKTVLRTLKLLIISFLICLVVASLIYMIGIILAIYTRLFSTIHGFHDWIWITYKCFLLLNNAVNCFVYAGYIKDFQKFLKRMFCLLRRSTREPDNQHEMQNVYHTEQSSLE